MKRWIGVWAGLLACGATAHAQVNFSGGFGTGTGLQMNGTASVQSGRLRITDNVNNQTGSAFFTTKQTVTSFTTTFQIQVPAASAPPADGLTFCWQNSATTALGTGGGNLGYAGIASSVCVKFDNYQGANEPSANQTGLFADGRAPMTAGAGTGDLVVDLTPHGIDLRDTTVKTVTLTYSGGSLSVLISDGTDTYNATWAIDLPARVGGTTAWVGFTGSTGGLNARQEIVNWTYSDPPAAPTGVDASDDQTNQITLTWFPAAGATSYDIYRSTSSGGPYALIHTEAAPSTLYVDVVSPGVYYYVIRARSGGGVSGNSNEAQGYSVPVPRVNDHKEGFFEDNCSCGASAGGPPWAAALAALAASLLSARRRPRRSARA